MPIAEAADTASRQALGVRALAMPPGWLLAWMLAVILLLVTGGPAAFRHEFADPDNALRLVQVRDLLAGQSWHDPVQYRLNPPEGVPMHWARWIDGVLALQIGALTPLLGSHAAETAVALAWPIGLLGLLMHLVSGIGHALGAPIGKAAQTAFAAPVILALSFPAIEKFGPGYFDHHNVVMVLFALAFLAVLRLHQGPVWGVVLGLSVGLAMGTAAEALPLSATLLVVAGLRWVFQPEPCARALLWMGLSAAVMSGLMLAIQTPPSLWGQPVCDAISRGFAGAGIAAALVACLLVFIGQRLPAMGWSGRLATAGVAGGIAGAGLLALFPECAGGGYGAMSETLATLWLPQVSEARSLFAVAADDLTLLLASAGAPVVALATALVFRKSPGVWVGGVLLTAAIVVMVWQVRGATFATLLAAPLCALAVVKARDGWRSGGSVLAFGGILLVATPASWAAAGSWLEKATNPGGASALASLKSDARACLTADALAQLNGVPAGVILNEFSMGAAILQHTHHSVLAAPYHRNEAGLTATVEIFREDGAARPAAMPASVDYVLVCPGLPEGSFYASHPAEAVKPKDTLASRLARGETPGWLSPVEGLDTPFRLYRVVR